MRRIWSLILGGALITPLMAAAPVAAEEIPQTEEVAVAFCDQTFTGTYDYWTDDPATNDGNGKPNIRLDGNSGRDDLTNIGMYICVEPEQIAPELTDVDLVEICLAAAPHYTGVVADPLHPSCGEQFAPAFWEPVSADAYAMKSELVALNSETISHNNGEWYTYAVQQQAWVPRMRTSDGAWHIIDSSPVAMVITDSNLAVESIGGPLCTATFELDTQDPDPLCESVNPNVFFGDIEWLAAEGITKGCAPLMFCPYDFVTRGQMAAFLDRALGLPATTEDFFEDDDTSQFEDAINRLAASGITKGTSETTFSPWANVTRGQMAAFLNRAFNLPPTDVDYFVDDNESIFEGDINELAESGITKGTSATTFSPWANVTRGQMAAFLHRALG